MSPGGASVPRLHVVTDDGILERPDFLDRARRVLGCGPAVALHLRGPRTAARRLWELGCALHPPEDGRGDVGTEERAALLVNDRVDVARLIGAAGAHLGRRSLPVGPARTLLPSGSLLGASIHGVEEARAVAAGGPDYLMVGTIFPTESHPGRPGAGPELLRRVADVAAVPLVAVGGVTPEQVGPCLRAGAHGVAVLRGVWNADDTERAVSGYVEALETTLEDRP